MVLAKALLIRYIVKPQNPIFFDEKMTMKTVKIKKHAHAYKGYMITYNVELLNSFNPELQFEDTESATRNELKDLYTESKGFKFVTTFI